MPGTSAIKKVDTFSSGYMMSSVILKASNRPVTGDSSGAVDQGQAQEGAGLCPQYRASGQCARGQACPYTHGNLCEVHPTIFSSYFTFQHNFNRVPPICASGRCKHGQACHHLTGKCVTFTVSCYGSCVARPTCAADPIPVTLRALAKAAAHSVRCAGVWQACVAPGVRLTARRPPGGVLGATRASGGPGTQRDRGVRHLPGACAGEAAGITAIPYTLYLKYRGT